MRVVISFLCSFVLSTVVVGQTAGHVVISEVYGGGGNSGATYKHDFIELYNLTDFPVDLTGWSVQYASGTGSTWQVTALTGSISAYGFYLIQEAQGSGGTLDLPAPDDSGTIAMSATAGKVALVNVTAALSDSNPAPESYVDLVGYGKTNGFEGTKGVPALSNTESAERKAQSSSTAASMAMGGSDALFGNGCDTDDNLNDFVVQSAINPQNTSSSKEKLVDIPLQVLMRSTSAKVEPGKIVLTFSTSSEVDIAGFNILRAIEKEGTFDLISGYLSNPALRACGEDNFGAEYTFTDLKISPGHTYYYKIESVSKTGKTEQAGDILSVSVEMPENFALSQNFPNPFNPVTAIEYRLSVASRVTLRVYDAAGREVAVLVDALQSAGVHSAAFDGSGHASGVYIYRLESESSDGERYRSVKKMILVK